VLIRGYFIAPKVFSKAKERVEIKYTSQEGVFAIIPFGFALTYCNSPIVVYEKNARTVCSFGPGEISLVAKNVSALAATESPPAIRRDAVAKAVLSRLPLTVRACKDTVILTVAKEQLSGSQPVVFADVPKDALTDEDFKKVKMDTTLIWKVNDVIVVGLQGFNFICGHLEIGSTATLYLAEQQPDGSVNSIGTVSVLVLPAEE
jgi:hypothetical protein